MANLPQYHRFDFNSYSAYGQSGYTHGGVPKPPRHVLFDLPLYRQVRAIQANAHRFGNRHFALKGEVKRDEWNQAIDSWIHRPPNAVYPPLPDGYSYVKDYSVFLRGKRNRFHRRDGFYECTWPRTGFHDLYVMSLWANTDERILIIEETELNNKVEEWASICAAMEHNTTYIVCEPAQMGRRLHRYTIVANFMHRLVVKTCLWTWAISWFWPHKRWWFWPPFLYATLGFFIYQDITKDAACNYQVVEDPYLISRFPLYRLRSMDAKILRHQSHVNRYFWQKIIFALTTLRVLYLTLFPAPPCICDWKVASTM